MRVKLYGSLRSLAPDDLDQIEFDVRDVKQCVEAFSTQCQGFLSKRPLVQIKGVNNEHDLLRTDMDTLHIYPAFVGGKRGGFFQIVIGAALIAVAVAVPGLGTIAGVAVASILFNAGLSLVLSGLLALIAPKPPSVTSSGSPEGSKYLPAQGNTTKIGTRIPLIYGRQQVYGHILSFNVTAADTEDTEKAQALRMEQDRVYLSAGGNKKLNAAQKGAGGYVYSASNLGADLTFDPQTRTLTASSSFSRDREIMYSVRDSAGDTVEVEVRVVFNFDDGYG